MYKLSDETKKRLSETTGIPYEKLIDMDNDEITAYIEQKSGKKMTYSKPHTMFTGSGDDSVLIDRGRLATMEDTDKRIEEIVKHHKSKQPKTIINKDKDDVISR